MTMMRHVSAAPAETRDDGDNVSAAPADDGDDDAHCWLDCDLIIIILHPPLVKVVGVVQPFPLSVLTDSAKSQLQQSDSH